MHTKYPDRICVIVEKSNNSIDIPDIDRNKFLIPKNLTIGDLMYVIRKRINLSPEKSIFLFINNLVMPTISSTINELYQAHKNKDGFLYVFFAGENTFG